jgi:hypothetical protein
VAAERALEARAFLRLDGDDPSLEFAATLIERCGDDEPIFVFNRGFEGGVLRSLCVRFPHLAGPLEAIRARLVDLQPIVARHWYHPSQQGSWSIKAVLPTMAPDLGYDGLDGVRDGLGAQRAYLRAIDPGTSVDERARLGRALLRYCDLDTLAMVRVWQVLSGAVADRQRCA